MKITKVIVYEDRTSTVSVDGVLEWFNDYVDRVIDRVIQRLLG